jgi:flagellar hook-length control protein FliK
MSLALISNVPAGTTLPTSGDVHASTDAAADPALAEIANSVFADVLRVITQTLDAGPTDPGAAAEGEDDDTTDEAANPDLVTADAMLPGMAMTMVPAALQAAGIQLAPTVQREGTHAGNDVAIGEVGAGGARRPAAAPPDALTTQVPGVGASSSQRTDASPNDGPTTGAASRASAPVAIDAAPVRAVVERQPLPTPTDASVASALATTLPADRDAGGADSVLKLNAAAPSQWRQPLQDALGDRLQQQLGRGSDHALIRLDPPTLGRIEILVRHENGSVQVHLSASNPEVLRQLNHIGDSLRQDLVARQHGEVSVTVSDTGRDAAGRERSRDQQPQPDDTTPHRALAEADDASTAATPFTLAHDRD